MKVDLDFTLDRSLVGDIGEAIAAELFGIALTDRNGAGIGEQVNGRSVRVKARGAGPGRAFRMVDTRADHLIVIDIDFENLTGGVVFNGPEEIALKALSER